jgi:hypothetical protein
MVFNSALYGALCQRFGRVRIVNPGVAMTGSYGRDPVRKRTKFTILEWGESYVLCCPFCGDQRGRLYVSHRFAVPDLVAGVKNLRLIRCFNEDCFRKEPAHCKQFADYLFGLVNLPQHFNRLFRPAVPAPVNQEPLGPPPPAPWPGRVRHHLTSTPREERFGMSQTRRRHRPDRLPRRRQDDVAQSHSDRAARQAHRRHRE